MVKNKLYSLQICRAIAACLVVLYHFSESANYFLGARPLHSFFMFGHSGVSFFFVLSGFIIAYIHRKDVSRPKIAPTYVVKRLIRIYPFYWPVLIAVTLGYLLFGTHPGGFNVQSINVEYFLKSLMLTSYSAHPIVVVAWTLVHEVFFYFIFSLLLLNKRLGLVTFFFWSCFIIFANYFSMTFSNSFITFLASYYNLEFLMGCLCAWIFCKHSRLIKMPMWFILIGVALFLINGVDEVYYHQRFAFYLWQMNDALKDLTYAASSFLIILGSVKIETEKNSHFPKIFLLMGNASYSIYLTHNYILGVLFRLFARLISVFPQTLHVFIIDVLLVVAFLISVTLGILYYQCYEKPILHFLRKKLLKSPHQTSYFPIHPENSRIVAD